MPENEPVSQSAQTAPQPSGDAAGPAGGEQPKRGPGRPRKEPVEPPATRKLRLHSQFIHSGVWYGPGDVELPDQPQMRVGDQPGKPTGPSVADDIQKQQSAIMNEQSTERARLGPTMAPAGSPMGAPISQPSGPNAEFADKTVLTKEDFEKMGQQSDRAAYEAAQRENQAREEARQQAEGRAR